MCCKLAFIAGENRPPAAPSAPSVDSSQGDFSDKVNKAVVDIADVDFFEFHGKSPFLA